MSEQKYKEFKNVTKVLVVTNGYHDYLNWVKENHKILEQTRDLCWSENHDTVFVPLWQVLPNGIDKVQGWEFHKIITTKTGELNPNFKWANTRVRLTL